MKTGALSAVLITWIGAARPAAAEVPAPVGPEEPQPSPAPLVCPPGRSVTADTDGRCCWSAQVWSAARAACVGIPASCPAGLHVHDEACVVDDRCEPGLSVTPDTDGHCCWPGQAWSREYKRCAGIPRCPSGLVVWRERCFRPVRRPEPAPAPARVALDPHAGRVPVVFEARMHRYRYRLTIAGQTCETPCKLWLPPGAAHLAVTGDGSVSRDLVIPPRPARLRVQHTWTGEVIAGIVLSGLGLGLASSNLAILDRTSNGQAIVAFGRVLSPISAILGVIVLGVPRARLAGRRPPPHVTVGALGFARDRGGAGIPAGRSTGV